MRAWSIKTRIEVEDYSKAKWKNFKWAANARFNKLERDEAIKTTREYFCERRWDLLHTPYVFYGEARELP